MQADWLRWTGSLLILWLIHSLRREASTKYMLGPTISARVEDHGRKVLEDYNEKPDHNPLGLYPACGLYENKTYERLVDRFGASNVYIPSAGWGLMGQPLTI
jgi:hypothetical protein